MFIEIHEDFVGKWKPTRDELVSFHNECPHYAPYNVPLMFDPRVLLVLEKPAFHCVFMPTHCVFMALSDMIVPRTRLHNDCIQ